MRMTRDMGGHAAKRNALECAKAARAHDDEVTLLLCRDGDRYLGGIALLDTSMRVHAARNLMHEFREEAICRDLQLGGQIATHADLLECGDMCVVVNHHEDCDLGICRADTF